MKEEPVLERYLVAPLEEIENQRQTENQENQESQESQRRVERQENIKTICYFYKYFYFIFTIHYEKIIPNLFFGLEFFGILLYMFIFVIISFLTTSS